MMKHVGEAVKRRALVGHGREKINVIGIASWGVIDKPEKLISEVSKVNMPFNSLFL